MKTNWIVKGIFVFLFFIGFAFLVALAVKLLWNALMPDIFGLPIISFWQAAGLLVLSRLLVGGFMKGGGGWKNHKHGMHGGWKSHWKNKWEEKWSHLSPEEQERLKQKFRNKCGMGKQSPFPPATPTEDQE